MKEIKCEHCGEWVKTDQAICPNCGGRFQDVYHREREEMAKVEPSIGLVKIDPESPWLKKKALQFVRIAQLIFFAIVSTIAAIASSTAH